MLLIDILCTAICYDNHATIYSCHNDHSIQKLQMFKKRKQVFLYKVMSLGGSKYLLASLSTGDIVSENLFKLVLIDMDLMFKQMHWTLTI